MSPCQLPAFQMASGERRGKFVCIAQFGHKATQSALQGQKDYNKKKEAKNGFNIHKNR